MTALGVVAPWLRLEGGLEDPWREGPRASGVAEAIRGLRALGEVDAAGPAAALLLLAAVLHASGYGLVRLAGGVRSAPPTADAAWTATTAAALGGLGAAAFGAWAGGAAPVILGGIVAGSILHFGGPRPAGGSSPPAGIPRTLGLVLCGLLLALPAGALDLLLLGLLGVPAVPETWFTVASAAGGGWLRPGAVGVLGVVAAGSLALERAGTGVASRSLAAGAVLRVPVLAVLLGPSHPFRAAAFGLALAAMDRASVPLPIRAVLPALFVAALALLAIHG